MTRRLLSTTREIFPQAKFGEKLFIVGQSKKNLDSLFEGNISNQGKYTPSFDITPEMLEKSALTLLMERTIQHSVVMSPTTPFSAFGMEPLALLLSLTQEFAGLETPPLFQRYYRSPSCATLLSNSGWSFPEIAQLIAEITYGIQPPQGEGYRTNPSNLPTFGDFGILPGKYNLGWDKTRVTADIWAELKLQQEIIKTVSEQIKAGKSQSEIIQAAIKISKKWTNDLSISGVNNMAIKIAAAISKLNHKDSHSKLLSEIETICKKSRTYRVLTGGDSLTETDLYRLSQAFSDHQIGDQVPLMEIGFHNLYKITSKAQNEGKLLAPLPKNDITALLEAYKRTALLAKEKHVKVCFEEPRILPHANEPPKYRDEYELNSTLAQDSTILFLEQLLALGVNPNTLRQKSEYYTKTLKDKFEVAKAKREENMHLISLLKIMHVSNRGPTALSKSTGVVHNVTLDSATGSLVSGAQLENQALLKHLHGGGHLVAQEQIGKRSENSEGRGVYFTAEGTEPYKSQVHFPDCTSESDLAMMVVALSRAGHIPIGLFPHVYFNMVGQLLLRLLSTEGFDNGGTRFPMGAINVMPNGAGRTVYCHGSAQAPVDEPNQAVIHINFANQIEGIFNLAHKLAKEGTVVTIIVNPDIYGEKVSKNTVISDFTMNDIIRYRSEKSNPDLAIVTMATGARAARALQQEAANNASHPLAGVSIEIIELPCSGYPNALPQQLATLKPATRVLCYDPYFDFGGMGGRIAQMQNDESLSHLRIRSADFPKIHDANNQVKGIEDKILLEMIQSLFSLGHLRNEIIKPLLDSPVTSHSNDKVAIMATGLNPGIEGTIQKIYVESGKLLKTNQLLASIEVDKGSTDVLAPADGYYQPVVKIGDKVTCETLLFYISDKLIKDAPKEQQPISAVKAPLKENNQSVPLSRNQLRMLENLQRSAQIATATVHYQVPITNTISYMNRLNENNENPLKLLPFILKATAMALTNSEMNYQVGKDLKSLLQFGKTVNLGVAVSTNTRDLVVVRLSNVQDKTVVEIHNELKPLIERALIGKSKSEDLDMTDVSTVISNMGSSVLNVVGGDGLLHGDAPNLLILGSYQEIKMDRPRPGKKSESKIELPVSITFNHLMGGDKTRELILKFQQQLQTMSSDRPTNSVPNQHSFWKSGNSSSSSPQSTILDALEDSKVKQFQ